MKSDACYQILYFLSHWFSSVDAPKWAWKENVQVAPHLGANQNFGKNFNLFSLLIVSKLVIISSGPQPMRWTDTTSFSFPSCCILLSQHQRCVLACPALYLRCRLSSLLFRCGRWSFSRIPRQVIVGVGIDLGAGHGLWSPQSNVCTHAGTFPYAKL